MTKRQITETEKHLKELTRTLPELRAAASRAEKAYQKATKDTTAAGVDEQINARARHDAAVRMVEEHEQALLDTQGHLETLRAAAEREHLEEAHATALQAHSDALAEWYVTAGKFVEAVQAALLQLEAADRVIGDATREVSTAAAALGLDNSQPHSTTNWAHVPGITPGTANAGTRITAGTYQVSLPSIDYEAVVARGRG